MRPGPGLSLIALGLALAASCKDGGHTLHPSSGSRLDGSADVTAPFGRALPLVPRPQTMSRREGTFVIDVRTTIAIEDAPEARAIGERLARSLGLPSAAVVIAREEPSTGIVLRLTEGGPHRRPEVDPPREADDESFTLDVSRTRAIVRGRRPAGLFYGSQLLAALAGARRVGVDSAPLTQSARWSLPCVTVEDAPRFPFRAIHLDVARHFFSKAFIERYIDLLALYRFNVFHWHLTDDQGFRFEVKSHPELTRVGGTDGFYTQDDVREVIAYARERFVTVIPEIEMPGHARAILAAHPELSCTGRVEPVPRTWGVFEDVLCAGNEGTFALLGDILGEAAAVFPSRRIHLGGDEVPTARWSACPKCRAAMKSRRTSVTGLEAAFLQRAASILARSGKLPVVWDEALSDDLDKNAIVIAWQSRERGREAALRGHDVVMAPHDQSYLNTRQSSAPGEPGHEGLLPWTTVLAFNPIPEGLEPSKAHRIVGAEGALWTEYVETPDAIEAMAMPRMAALSEALWAGPPPSEADFITRFGAQLPMLDASVVRYFVEPPTGLRPRRVLLQGQSLTLELEAPRLFPHGVVRWTIDGTEPTPASPPLFGPVTLKGNATIAAALFLPGGRTSTTVRSAIVEERPRPATVLTAPSKGAHCTYLEGSVHRLADLERLTPKLRGRVASIGLTAAERAFPSMRKERFGLRFDGFVEVPADGVYRFFARADDGVRLEVDGETILEDDGEHAPREADGEIALARGHHRLALSYFQGSEGKALELAFEGPDLPLRPLDPVVGGAP